MSGSPQFSYGTVTRSPWNRPDLQWAQAMTKEAWAFGIDVGSWRREPGGVGRLRRVHRHVCQLGDGDQLAPGRLDPAEQDAELGVHGDLDAVIGPFGGTGSEHITARRGRDRDRVAATGGHRPSTSRVYPPSRQDGQSSSGTGG